jgi:malate dehydrogenase (oxaloacetate-decarboxylating)
VRFRRMICCRPTSAPWRCGLPGAFRRYATRHRPRSVCVPEGLQDANETLFRALLTRDLEETYTPTVGEGCQTSSHHYWHYPRGLFSWPYRDRIARRCPIRASTRSKPSWSAMANASWGSATRACRLPIGKLSLYAACAGLPPATTLPILLDVGTDNGERLADPVYIGWQHERVCGRDCDDFIESFVSAALERWPHVLLQWGDFARTNAGRMPAALPRPVLHLQ